MEADVAAMMADLGNARRDFISAPEADAKGRSVREDAYAQRNTLNDFEQRRERIKNGKPPPEKLEEAKQLKAWNSTDLFESDEVTEQLENRFSGQGHRARLAASLAEGRVYDRQWEATEARFGEERRLYLQERSMAGNSNNNYVANAAPRPMPSQPRPRHPMLTDSTPRAFSGGHGGARLGERGRIASGPPNPNRAPSPRSFGTVRFNPNGERIERSAAGSAPRPPTAPSRTVPNGLPAQPRTMPNGMPAQPRAMPNGVPTQPRAMPNGTLPHASPIATATSQRAKLNDVPSQPRPSSAMISASNQHTEAQKRQYKQAALHYAACPQEESDLYYQNFPDRLPYHRPALISLIKMGFEYAKDPDNTEPPLKNQVWIFEAAKGAKDFVENKTEEEAEAYYALYSEYEEFYKGAKKNFKPISKDPAVPAPVSTAGTASATTPSAQPPKEAPTTNGTATSTPNASAPAVQPTSTSVAQPTSQTANSSKPPASTFTLRPATTPASQPTSASTSVSETPTQATAGPSRRTATAQQYLKKPPQAEPAQQTLPGTFPAEDEAPLRVGGAATRSSEETTTSQPPASSRDTSTRTSEETSITIPEPAPAPQPRRIVNQGTLSAVFRDLNMKFLGEESWPIVPPVRIASTVTSMDPRVNPQYLIETLQETARSLQGRAAALMLIDATTTQAVQAAEAPQRVGGHRMNADGLWASEDEEAADAGPIATRVRPTAGPTVEAECVGAARQTEDGLWEDDEEL